MKETKKNAPKPASIVEKGDRRHRNGTNRDVGILLHADAKSNAATLNSFVDECLVPVLVEQFLRERGLDSGHTRLSAPVKAST
jgi:hypothetical protein